MTQTADSDEQTGMMSGSAFFFASRVGGAALAYATQVLLARWMGASELGAYLFAFSACLLLSTLSGLGYPSASFRFIGHGRARGEPGYLKGYIRRARQISIGTGSGLSLAGLIVIFIAPELVDPQYRTLAALALLCVPVMALVRLHSDVANSFSWLGLTIVPNTLVRPLLFLCGSAIVWLTAGEIAAGTVMWLQLGSVLTIMVAQYLILRRALSATLGHAKPVYETGHWTRAATPMCFALLLTSYFPEFNLILVGLMLPAQDIAVFNAAFRTAFLIAFLINAVDANTMPQISILYAQRSSAKLQSLLAQAAAIKTAGALAAVLLLAVAGKAILGLFGAEFVAGHVTMLLLATGMLIQAAFGPVASILEIAGHQNRCLYVFGTATCIAAALHLVLAPAWGILGSAIAVLAAVCTWTIWLYVLVRHYVGVDPSIAAMLEKPRLSNTD
jgi:O-antigen/teichoic acid export membrane protein